MGLEKSLRVKLDVWSNIKGIMHLIPKTDDHFFFFFFLETIHLIESCALLALNHS